MAATVLPQLTIFVIIAAVFVSECSLVGIPSFNPLNYLKKSSSAVDSDSVNRVQNNNGDSINTSDGNPNVNQGQQQYGNSNPNPNPSAYGTTPQEFRRPMGQSQMNPGSSDLQQSASSNDPSNNLVASQSQANEQPNHALNGPNLTQPRPYDQSASFSINPQQAQQDPLQASVASPPVYPSQENGAFYNGYYNDKLRSPAGLSRSNSLPSPSASGPYAPSSFGRRSGLFNGDTYLRRSESRLSPYYKQPSLVRRMVNAGKSWWSQKRDFRALRKLDRAERDYTSRQLAAARAAHLANYDAQFVPY